MQRFCKAVCLLFACLPFLINRAGLTGLLLQPQNWPAIGLILLVVWLLRSVPNGSLRITLRCLPYFALYSATLLAAIARHSGWLAGVAFGLSVMLLSQAAGLRYR
ncbi:MAG: hypothetical protein ACOVRM_10990, partial [Planctomycetaceae bacterium]